MGQAGPDADSWDVPVLARLDVPVVQAVAATTSRAAWEENAVGLSPLDTAWSVALPEFDGRIIVGSLSFKEIVDDGDDLGLPVVAYRTVPDRVARVAGTAVRLAALRRKPNAEKRIAVVLSAYPTKRGRIGNAVGLDTPASVIGLLHSLASRRLPGRRHPRRRRHPHGRADRPVLLREGVPHDRPARAGRRRGGRRRLRRLVRRAPETVAGQRGRALGRTARLGLRPRRRHPPGRSRPRPRAGHGPAAPRLRREPDRRLPLPRPAADPPLPGRPTAGWTGRGAPTPSSTSASTATWNGCPARGSASRRPAGPMPPSATCPSSTPSWSTIPGEGTQAKRRAHAVIIDHLVPPMTRAEVYDDLARLERLLDEYYQVSTLDPAKLPALRAQIWELCERAALDHDLAAGAAPGDDDFDDFLLHLDGYLCELKDAQIRGGLHTLGRPARRRRRDRPPGRVAAPPAGPGALAAVRRGRRVGPRPGRCWPNPAAASTRPRPRPGWVTASDAIDAIDAEAKRSCASRTPAGPPNRRSTRIAPDPPAGTGRNRRSLTGVAESERERWGLPGTCSCPGCARPPTRSGTRSRALDGRYVPAGPRGPRPGAWPTCCRPGGTSTRSTRRRCRRRRRGTSAGNWPTRVCRPPPRRDGAWPASVGLVRLGHRRHAHPRRRHRRGPGPLGRPAGVGRGIGPGHRRGARPPRGARPAPHRRDAADQRVLPGRLPPPRRTSSTKPSRWSAASTRRRSRTSSGPTATTTASSAPSPAPTAPASSPSSTPRTGRTTTTWPPSTWPGAGTPTAGRGTASRRPRRCGGASPLIDVAVKNQDNREHDIFDSDDYLQEHGGMVATVRALRGGQAPQAYFGDSADPERPQVRTLAEEARRVVRSRVLNPRWISAMMRHGYKGAFEMAATVDYLYGYDATARDRRGLDVRAGDRGLRGRPRGAEVLRRLQPLGAAGDRRAAPRSRPPGGCGRRRTPAWPRCRRRCSRPRAGPRSDARDDALPAVGRRRPGRPQGRPAPPRRRPEARRRAHPGREGIGEVDRRPGAGHAHRPAPTARRRRRRSWSCRSAPPRTGSSAPSTSKAPCSKGGPGSGPGCWPPPIGASSTSTRSTCWPTISSTSCIDAAAFGVNRIERDGLTAEHPCRFVLVGSMNPEEGELRPQLLDRFGLAVEVRAPRDPEVRTEVVRRRLAFDADPEGFAERFAADEDALRAAIAGAVRRPRRRDRPRRGTGPDQPAVRRTRRRGPAGRPGAGPGRGRPWPPSTAARRPPPTTSPAWRRWPWPTAAAGAPSTPRASRRRNSTTPSTGPTPTASERPPRDRQADERASTHALPSDRPEPRAGDEPEPGDPTGQPPTEAAGPVRHARPLRRRGCSWP